MGYSHLDVHTSHLRILARLEGLEPPPDRVETGRSNPLSYKRMAESGVIETQPFRVTRLSKPARSLTDSLSKIKHSDLQVGRYSNWDVSRRLIKIKADIFRRAIKQRYLGVTLCVRLQTHLIGHHVSTFNAAVNLITLSFFTGEPVLRGRSFRNTENWSS